MTDDDWSDRCKDDFTTAITALVHLSQSGVWPEQRWRTALQVWSDPAFILRSWDELKAILGNAPERFIASIAHQIGWWLEALGKVIVNGEIEFFALVRRVLVTQTTAEFEGGDDPIFKAINHPIGQTTNAVFRW